MYKKEGPHFSDIYKKIKKKNHDEYHKSIYFTNLRFTNYLNLLLATKNDTADIKLNLIPMRK